MTFEESRGEKVFAVRDLGAYLHDIDLPEGMEGRRAVSVHLRQHDNAFDSIETRISQAKASLIERYPALASPPGRARIVEQFRALHPGALERCAEELAALLGPTTNAAEAEQAILASFGSYDEAKQFYQYIQSFHPGIHASVEDKEAFVELKFDAEQIQGKVYAPFYAYEQQQKLFWLEHVEEELGHEVPVRALPPNPETNLRNVPREMMARLGAQTPAALWLLSIARSHGIPLAPEDIRMGEKRGSFDTITIAPRQSEDGVAQPILRRLFEALDQASFPAMLEGQRPFTIVLSHLFVDGADTAAGVDLGQPRTFEGSVTSDHGQPALKIPIFDHSETLLRARAMQLLSHTLGREMN